MQRYGHVNYNREQCMQDETLYNQLVKVIELQLLHDSGDYIQKYSIVDAITTFS